MSGKGQVAAELHDLQRLRRRQAFPIPASACAVSGVLGISLSQIGMASFSLRRKRSGVEIMFVVPTGANSLFSWNVTSMLGLHIASFDEARVWAHAYAARHGHKIKENIKEREKRPTGADRKLLVSGGCKEAWLESDVPKLFAEAAVRCKHAGGFCLQDGFCHYGTCDMQMTA